MCFDGDIEIKAIARLCRDKQFSSCWGYSLEGTAAEGRGIPAEGRDIPA